VNWYWWVLIIAALLVFIPVKMKLTKAFLNNQKEKQMKKEKLLEDDE